MTVKYLRHGGQHCSVLGDKQIATSAVWNSRFRNNFFLIAVFLSSPLVLPRLYVLHDCLNLGGLRPSTGGPVQSFVSRRYGRSRMHRPTTTR